MDNEPFFDCFKCLDEVNEEYGDRVACTDCTGLENHIYKSENLLSSTPGTLGKNKDMAAYNRVLENYHSYLTVLLTAFLMNDSYHASSAEVALRVSEENPEVARDALYKELLLDSYKTNNFLALSADKFLAEQKCRQDPMHAVPDTVGLWEKNETHVSEHRPWLNNMSTSIKRQLVDMAFQTFLDPDGLEIGFWPIEFDSQEEFMAQPHAQGVQAWRRSRRIIESDTLRAPIKPGGRLPWEFVEYVPLFSNYDLGGRVGWLNENLDYWVSKLEAKAPKDRLRFFAEQEPERAKREEEFCLKTLELIHDLLAFDPGLSTPRMGELASWFMSIVIHPWLTEPSYGNIEERPPIPAGSYFRNENLRRILAFLDQRFVDLKWYDSVDEYWSNLAYGCGQNSVMLNSNAFFIKNPTARDVQLQAVMRWMDFYKERTRVIAEVGGSIMRVPQAELDRQIQEGSLSEACNVCGNAWAEFRSPYNIPVCFEPCGVRHAMCLGCLMQISLQPANLNGRKCPMCKQDIQYPLRHNVLSENFDPELMLPSLADAFA